MCHVCECACVCVCVSLQKFMVPPGMTDDTSAHRYYDDIEVCDATCDHTCDFCVI